MRPLTASIRLDNLRHNAALARKLHGGPMLAVIKANAYGHGALACARALQHQSDGFAVAFLDEALALRKGGITAPIVLLEGLFGPEELAAVVRHRLWPVVHNEAQLAMIENTSLQQPLTVWLKLDSGMHRAGFDPDGYASAHARLRASGNTAAIVKMTHFACADEADNPATARQIACFERATLGLAGEESIANSAGILLHEHARRGWGRPGIMLYGCAPDGGPDRAGLKPVMRLHSRIFAVCNPGAGEAVGYGARYVTSAPARIGLVACGYADGYPRSAGNGTPVAVDGRIVPLVGRVCMDMLMVDLSAHPAAGVGSSVELWGDQVDVNQVAQSAGTLGYELLCNVKRARFVYE
jgi:alanine racemase